MDEEDKIKNIYLSLKNKNRREWAEMMQQLTKDQKRRLIFYIKKKNKNSLNKINNIKAEKNIEKTKTKNSIQHRQQILIDYSNVNYDLNLKNYIARILRIYKLKDNFDFVKGLHLYMNILCHVIFKKFSFEYKKKEAINKNLLIFLKNLFPFEFQKFQEIYNMRWNKDFSTCKNVPHQNEITTNATPMNVTMDEEEPQKGKQIQPHSMSNSQYRTNKKDEQHLQDQPHLHDQPHLQDQHPANSNPLDIANHSYASMDEDTHNNCTSSPGFPTISSTIKDGVSVQSITKENTTNDKRIMSSNNLNVLVKKELEDPDYNKCNTKKEEKTGGGNIEEYINKNVKKEFSFYELCKNRDMNKILKNLYDEKRFDYRIRFRSILSTSLNNLEYKKYCDQREKLFKYKKKNFIKWLAQFTNINSLDLYIVNFFIFLFLDRLYLIVETYIRLNYYNVVKSPISSNEYLFDTVDDFQNFTHLLNCLTSISSCKSENGGGTVSYDSNKAIGTAAITRTCTDNEKKTTPPVGKQESEIFNEEYDNIVKENLQNFFLSLDLIYSIDIHNFKIINKIIFEKLIKVDLSSHVNETNIYSLIQFDEKKNISPWKTFTHFTLMQNRNLKLPKFDCFSIFLIVRFKYYLDEFKQYANIDYIYKTVEEEYYQIEKYLKSKNSNEEGQYIEMTNENFANDENNATATEHGHNNENEFEYNHLIPLYQGLHKELKKVNEYIRFYGNLLSFVSFIEKYSNSSPSKNIVKLEQEEEKVDYFDHSFFVASDLKDNVKKE
ncbi:hypothetical protein, conserved [Plasmodium gonderi]|uniref:Uncharacterized protein n=1 Tax=Plasmodium gonderi TaxID=77519 RepID=A0A1Y1JT97_PLAGO|nr:hypothetical protein, conserved [Plasmodium gonderi]GAW83164.1 hypothetical protein, conserved [Plasmodium gonderi]